MAEKNTILQELDGLITVPNKRVAKISFLIDNYHSNLYSECKSIKKKLEKRRIIENNKVFLHRETI